MKTFFVRLLVLGVVFAWVTVMVIAAQHQESLFDLTTMALLIFGIQWVVFLPSFLAKTEHFYDLTGGLTYVSVIVFLLYQRHVLQIPLDLRSALLCVFVSLWAFRLSSFLFLRVQRAGKDGRFDEIKISFMRFLVAWTLQGLWVFMCTYPVLIVLSMPAKTELPFLIAGSMMWLIGWSVEVIADRQKTKFNQLSANKNKFISSGLWAYSRHPNYFGEWLLWTGITVMAVPVFSTTQWLACITPAFVYLLLNKISGVNLLESRANEKWGHDQAYQDYCARTSVFFPTFKQPNP